jgi:hypothetical protein
VFDTSQAGSQNQCTNWAPTSIRVRHPARRARFPFDLATDCRSKAAMQRLTALQAGLVLLLSVCSCPALAKRNVLQEAISNSNGCLNDIPKCEQYACVTRNIKGVARWACQRCQGSYQAVVDDSGQDNIIQCGKSYTWTCRDTLASSCQQFCLQFHPPRYCATVHCRLQLWFRGSKAGACPYPIDMYESLSPRLQACTA